MCRREGVGRGLARAIVGAAIAALLVVTTAAAAPTVKLIRTYDSDVRGLVYEVCRGGFDPPVTDPENPAYCRGEVEYWTEHQWQVYNAHLGQAPTGKSEGAAAGGGKGAKAPGKGSGAESGVARGGGGAGEVEAEAASPYGGSLDPTEVLGIENPLCGSPEGLSAKQLRNCRSSHSPEAAYPVGNYGWDIHIESGGFITSLFAPAVSFVMQLLSGLWLVLLMFLKGCLIVLGFAFSLSPFTDNKMLRGIGAGLGGLFEALTSPWLTTLFVILGIWGLYNGIIRRRAGETLGGILAALVMMLGAMWVIHSPRQTVGRVAEAVNGASLLAVSAPASGDLSAPLRSYNDAMARVWNQMTAVPFCAMNFSDVHWCMTAKPSQKALEAAKGGLGLGDAFTQQLLAHLPKEPDEATKVLERDLAVLFGPAPTIRDLYLRFSPAGGPRDALWDYFNGKPDEKVGLPLEIGPQLDIGGGSTGVAPEKVSMQGRSGVLTRIVMVVVFYLGLAGGLLLLLWIAVKLVMATASAFILVLATPLAMFMPVFGAAGRAAFVRWATSLLGAIVAKLVFSGLLGIVLLGSSIIGNAVGGSSPTLGLVGVMAFWWAVFLSREKYLAIFQVDPVKDRDLGLYRALAGGYLGYRVATAAKGAVGALREGRAERRRAIEATRGRSERRVAERELDRQAEQRLEVKTGHAQKRESSREEVRREAAALRADPEVRAHRAGELTEMEPGSREAVAAKAERLGELEEQIRSSSGQSRVDRRLLERQREAETAGLPRHGAEEIRQAREQIVREAELPAGHPEHRWRAEAAGKDPDTPEGERAIAESLATTRAAAGAASSERLEQIDLRRPGVRVGGDQRRADTSLRYRATVDRAGTGNGPDSDTAPRARRRRRAREWLSR